MIFRKKPDARKDRAKPLRRRLLGAFLRDRDGATAIEFVVLALPFSMLVFAILESCISFAAQQLMINATDDIAREFRTGQLKAADVNEVSLKNMICERIDLLMGDNCADELEVDLREFATFEEAADVKIAFTESHDIDTSDFDVDPGPALSKNMLRVFYRWTVMTDFIRKSMSNLKDDKTLLFATATWQNEPFND